MATNPPLPEPGPDDDQPVPDPGPDTVARPTAAELVRDPDPALGNASNGGARPDPAAHVHPAKELNRTYGGPENPNATRRR